MEKVYCAIRKVLVAATPEEKVRQHLLRHMTVDLGFPPALIALEKGLSQMPHVTLTEQKIPDRRADIVCFAKGIHPQHDLYPLLLVECKAVKLTPKVVNQVSGYNHFLRACFICMANQEQVRTGWYDPVKQGYDFVDHLPSYSQLLKSMVTANNS